MNNGEMTNVGCVFSNSFSVLCIRMRDGCQGVCVDLDSLHDYAGRTGWTTAHANGMDMYLNQFMAIQHCTLLYFPNLFLTVLEEPCVFRTKNKKSNHVYEYVDN